MKISNHVIIVIIMVLVSASIVMSCSEPVTNHYITGTITIPTAIAGRTCYIYVDTDTTSVTGITTGTVVYTPNGITSFNYVVVDIPPGEYYVYGLVDVDSSNTQNNGDYMGMATGSPITIEDDDLTGIDMIFETIFARQLSKEPSPVILSSE